MIKKIITYTDIDENFEETERTETVRFFYTLKSIKNYEQKTGSNFFEDYDKAYCLIVNTAGPVLGGGKEELTDEQLTALAPLVYSPQINNFLMDFIPCLYAKTDSGKIVQDEETIQEAEDSLWITQLISPGFFTEIFLEISKNQFKIPDNKKKTSSKKK